MLILVHQEQAMFARNRSAWAVFAMGLVALLSAGAAPAQKDEKPAGRSKFEPVEFQGVLAMTDPPDASLGGPCRLYRVEMSKGKRYIIDLISTDFDAYLRLEDLKSNELARDDDSGGNLNARITYTPLSDGPYQIIATSLNRVAGKFTLKVQEVGAAPVAKARLLELKKDGLKVDDNLANTDPRDNKRAASSCKIYMARMKAGKTYQIDMTSAAIDPYLRLEDKNGVPIAEDDDSGGFPNARLVFTCQQEGDYRIIATSFVAAEGAYTLQIVER